LLSIGVLLLERQVIAIAEFNSLASLAITAAS